MEIALMIVIILLIILLFKRLDNIIIFIGLIDIALRIIYFIGNNTTQGLKSFVIKYFPNSIPFLIGKYTNGIIETILNWGYVIVMIMFCYYVTKILIKRAKKSY